MKPLASPWVFVFLLACTPGAKETPLDPTATYATQDECSIKTNKTCDFVQCDHVAPGKTVEETCGKGFTKGWRPRP